MRILHVAPGVSPAFGSPANLPELLRRLNQGGIETALLTTNADRNGRLDVPLNQRVMRGDVLHIFHNVWRIAGRYGLAPSMVRTLRRTIESYDLVHIHWLYGFTCIAAARAALSAGVPFVIQPHGSLLPCVFERNTILKRVYLATVGRPLLRRAAAIVFTAEQERLLAPYAPRRPEWIVPFGIEESRFEHLPPRGTFRAAFPRVDGPFLLFLGRLSPQKGLDLLLPAFERLIRERTDLWLVVAGPDDRGYESEVRTLARQLGIERRVLFTGLLTHEQRLAAFADAELFVLSSHGENFGIVITEALASGLPVVISDQVGIHRELAAAGAATVVQCTVESVAAGIESALADTGLRRRIASIGPTFVRAHYTWEAIVPPLIQRYAEVIAAAGASRSASRELRRRESHG